MMGRMPSYITPPEMPGDVVTAIETMGSRARTEMLRVLAASGPLTRAELSAGLREHEDLPELPQRQVMRHLQAMEDEGLVICDVPRAQRQGRVTHWTANLHRAHELATTWLSYLSGTRPDRASRSEQDEG